MDDEATVPTSGRPMNLGGVLSLIYLAVVGIFVLIIMTSNFNRMPERFQRELALFDNVLAFPLKQIASPVTTTIKDEDVRLVAFVVVRLINCFLCGYFAGWVVGRIRRADASGAVRMYLSLILGIALLGLGGYLFNDGLGTQSNTSSDDHLTPWIMSVMLIAAFLCFIGGWLLKQALNLNRQAAATP